ncbi:MAG: hypothetical protein F4X65_01320 [Chloroflexi bacterium]|nr:hypothetical protein [Chloroflexota bacterium]
MIDQAGQPRNYLSRVRGIALMPGERVARVFSLQEGMLEEPSGTGQLLIATNHRILFFKDEGNSREATLLPIEELNGITIDTSEKGTLSPLRGILTMLAALAFYLLVAYWISGQIDSPALPGLNIDFIPFFLLAAVLVGAWLYWRHNVRRAGGQVTLQGSSWNLSFTVLGAERIPDINSVVECLYLCREERWSSLVRPTAH